MSCGINGYFCPDHINDLSVQNIVPLKWMPKSFFTLSRSIVTLAAFWKLNKHSDHSSLERMSTFFVPRANHFFKFSCIMIKTLDNWKSIPTIHPVKGRRQFFCKEYYHCFTFLVYWQPLTIKGHFCVPLTWLDQFNQCQRRSNKDGSWQIGPLADLALNWTPQRGWFLSDAL